MRLNVSAWAIRKPLPSIVLFLVLMVLGLVSFRSLPITRFPNIDIRSSRSRSPRPARRLGAADAGHEMGRGFGGRREGRETRPLAITEGISTTTIEFRLEITRTAPSTT